jgi:hypothetical protein
MTIVNRVVLSAMAIFSWCVAQFITHPRPTFHELVETLRHPDPEPFS